jgi:4-hydroxy-3-polyprenylbenzoate decarboxylase
MEVVSPGILALSGPEFTLDGHERGEDPLLTNLEKYFPPDHPAQNFPLWVITERADFLAQAWENFLWATFTRSDPATDIYGCDSFVKNKHWGCSGSLVIDARIKPHHAPALEEDSDLVKRIENLAAPGRPLYGIF